MSEKKGQRRRMSKAVPVVIAIAVAAVFVFLILFHTRNINIEGRDRVSEEEIYNEIYVDRSMGNTVLLWLLNGFGKTEGSDLIQNISVEIENPWTARVTVEEVNLLGCVKNGDQYCYFNGSGIVILATDQKEKNVPTVSGLTVKKAQVGQKLEAQPEEAVSDLAAVSSCLQQQNLTCSSLTAEPDGSYTAVIGDITVQLGKNTYMEEKIGEVANLQDKLKGKKGTLHLENYDASSDSIVFTQQ